ncbi:TPA: DUF3899 domain-containing protein, partial [Enterococcus faecium]|nr:DUF3899 domain-containing protein [Enterococcus faecium]HAQ9191194.1 DUF3899 domain-containing protein [Enterococcus faecium]
MKKKSIPYAVAFLLILVILIKNLINHSFTLIQLSNDLFLWSLPF